MGQKSFAPSAIVYQIILYVETEVHDVAVIDHILLAFYA